MIFYFPIYLTFNLLFVEGCYPTQRNKCCVFPFWYMGHQRYSCIKDNHNQPWCATTDNYDRDQLWDNCQGTFIITIGSILINFLSDCYFSIKVPKNIFARTSTSMMSLLFIYFIYSIEGYKTTYYERFSIFP